MKNILSWIAAGFGLGYMPKAPGTWGTLLGYPLWYALSLLPFQQFLAGRLAAACIPMLVAIPLCSIAEKNAQKPDPGWVVLDEAIAIPFCLLFYTPSSSKLFAPLLLSFLLFRFFDILKPPPIFQIQRLSSGMGVVLDDVLAGIYTALVLLCLKWIGVPGL